MKTYDLRRLQLYQLDLLLEVIRICSIYKIDFFLIGGSLLGAIRHNGYIPWDDDLDIGMIREDYNRFIEVCKIELDNQYFLQTARSDIDFGLGFAKIKINGTLQLEKVAKNNKSHKGIFIDIFPLDHYPNNKIDRFIQKNSVWFLKRMLLEKCNYDVEAHSILKKIIKVIVRFMSHTATKSFVLKHLENAETKFNCIDNSHYINLEGSYGYKELVPVNCVNNLELHIFEGYRVKILGESHLYLRNLYGDYLTPPPLDKRNNRHGIERVDFGDYIVRNSRGVEYIDREKVKMIKNA